MLKKYADIKIFRREMFWILAPKLNISTLFFHKFLIKVVHFAEPVSKNTSDIILKNGEKLIVKYFTILNILYDQWDHLIAF